MGYPASGTLPDALVPRSSTHRPIRLLVLTALIVFSPLLEGGSTHLAVMVIRLMVLFLLSSILWQAIRTEQLPAPSLRLWAPVLTYLVLAVASVALSPYRHQSAQWLAVLASYAVLLYILVVFIEGWTDAGTLLIAATGIGLIEAGWALAEVWWGESLRSNGSFFNPNFLAGYLAAIATVILGNLCYAKTGVSSLRPIRVCPWRLVRWMLFGATLTILLAAVVVTGSRGGILAAAVGGLVVLGLRFGRRGLAVLGLLLLIGLLAPNPFRDRLYAEHVANPVSYARLQIWQSTMLAMAEHPFGIGLGLFQYVSPQYMFPVEGQIARYGKVAVTAHNEYLQMGLELGIASVAIFLWGVILIGQEAAWVLKQRLRRWQRGAAAGITAAIAGVLVHASVDSTLHEPAIAILLAVLVGVLFAVRRFCGVADSVRAYRLPYPRVYAAVAVILVTWLVVGTLKMGLAWVAFEAGSRAVSRQEFPSAFADYRIAIALDPGKALYHSAAAGGQFQYFQRTGEAEAAQRAIAELQSAIALNPLDGRLSGLLGSVYFALSAVPGSSEQERAGLLHAALAAYQRAAELEPFSPWHRFEIGRLYVVLADRPRAEASLGGALSLEPNFLPGRALLARVYLESRRPGEAQRQYQEILERQQRYAAVPKDSLEQAFLKVDVTALQAALQSSSRSRGTEPAQAPGV